MPDAPDWTTDPQAIFAQQIQSLLNVGITATEAGANGDTIAGVAGRRINLVSLAVDPSYGPGGDIGLRDLVTVVAVDVITGIALARATIGPESPHAEAKIVPGQATAGVGNGVQFRAASAAGSGSQGVALMASWYLA